MHGDACPQNLLVPADDPGGFIAVDWSTGELAAVGYDLGGLLVGLAHAGRLEVADLPRTADGSSTPMPRGWPGKGCRSTSTTYGADSRRCSCCAARSCRCRWTGSANRRATTSPAWSPTGSRSPGTWPTSVSLSDRKAQRRQPGGVTFKGRPMTGGQHADGYDGPAVVRTRRAAGPDSGRGGVRDDRRTELVVLLSGEAGIGKTSVVRELADRLGPGVRRLAGACDDLLAPRALGPLRDAFRGSGGPVERVLADGGTDAVFEAVLGELAGPRVTVLVVEDLHWADDATVDLLRYLARRLDRLRAVLVLTFRPDTVDTRHPLRALLGELSGDRCRRIALEPLSPPRSVADRRLGPRCHRAVRADPRQPVLPHQALAGPAGGVPETVVDAILAGPVRSTRTVSTPSSSSCRWSRRTSTSRSPSG